jgi:hypothetical protein
LYSKGLGNGGICCTTSSCSTVSAPTCPSGYTLGGDSGWWGYTCYKSGSDTVINNWCPSGTIGDPRLNNLGVTYINSSGHCVYDYGAPSCGTGTSLDSSLCSAVPTCVGGGTFDTTNGVCYNTSMCPTNDFTLNATTKICTRTL